MPLRAQPREEQGRRGHGHGGNKCSRAKGSWALVDQTAQTSAFYITGTRSVHTAAPGSVNRTPSRLRTPDSPRASRRDTEVLQPLPRAPRPTGPDSPELQLDPPSIQQDGGRLIVDSWKEAEGSCRRRVRTGPP